MDHPGGSLPPVTPTIGLHFGHMDHSFISTSKSTFWVHLGAAPPVTPTIGLHFGHVDHGAINYLKIYILSFSRWSPLRHKPSQSEIDLNWNGFIDYSCTKRSKPLRLTAVTSLVLLDGNQHNGPSSSLLIVILFFHYLDSQRYHLSLRWVGNESIYRETRLLQSLDYSVW